MDDIPGWMRRAFSPARLAPYLRAADSPGKAVALYWWNIEVSAAFFGPISCLETTLRNALHRELTTAYGTPGWWDDAPLDARGRSVVSDTRRKVARLGGDPALTDAMVAELSFGFWVSLLSKGKSYDRRFWVPTLHRAFPHYKGRRDTLHDGMHSLLLLRNRIMHHEPVHHRALADDHAKIYRMLGYLDPEAADGIRPFDRVPEVLRDRAATLSGTRTPRF